MKSSIFTGLRPLLLVIFFLWVISGALTAQKNSSMITQDRTSAVAGMFYEKDSSALTRHLQQLFSVARPPWRPSNGGETHVAALIAPHAGYIYSGQVAASAYNQLPADAVYKRIFLIGSSHRMSFRGASVYSQGDYLTPLGRVEVDREVAQKLVDGSRYFTSDAAPHLQEHSLEVQLPFLQHHLNHSFKLVPIVLGTRDAGMCQKIAEALKPWFGGDNLFIISSDFSHYPAYEDANRVDERTVSAILENNPQLLLEILDANKNENIPGLATSLCGWTSVLTLLHLTCEEPGITFKQIDYKNSGDARMGDKERVVGYQAVAIFRAGTKEESGEPHLSETEKGWLLKRARQAVGAAVRGETAELPHTKVSAHLSHPAGVFVSLYKKGELRGCIGSFGGECPLWQMVDRMAASASMHDSRFQPLTEEEAEEVVIELSVLSPKRRIKEISEIVPGKHGVMVEKNGQNGIFLPQVASRNGWDTETFLGYCARDKAKIGWDGWKEAEIYVFETIVIREKRE